MKHRDNSFEILTVQVVCASPHFTPSAPTLRILSFHAAVDIHAVMGVLLEEGIGLVVAQVSNKSQG